MSHSTSSSDEQNGYFFDTESATEMVRLIHLDSTTTKAMKGPLSGIKEPSEIKTALDIACGPGGWVLDVAFEYPHIEVAGIDISQTMIKYATARAVSEQRQNASFGVMNATSYPLDFSDASFDLVNARFLFGVLQATQWPSFLAECRRILRPGGLLRITDALDGGITNSPAYERLNTLFVQAFHKAGYLVAPGGRTPGLFPVLPGMLRKLDFTDLQIFSHNLEFSAGCESWNDMYHNAEMVTKLAGPFFQKMGVGTQEDADEIHQQTMIDMNSEDFCGIWHFDTVIARKA